MLVLAYDSKSNSKTRGFCKLFKIIELKNKTDKELFVKVHNNTIIKVRKGLIRHFTNQIKLSGSDTISITPKTFTKDG